jgi:hypothetical protein
MPGKDPGLEATMAKDDKPAEETLTITRAALDAMIATAAEVATKIAVQHTIANAGIDTPNATREQRAHAELGTPIPKRECVKTMHYPCRNPRNGATFVAVVVPSNKWTQGRTVNLIEYRYPEDLAKRSGKQVHPNGKYGGIRVDAVYPFTNGEGIRGPFLPEFAQWVYEMYHKADINAFVGQSAELLPTTGEAVEWKPESQARTAGEAGVY